MCYSDTRKEKFIELCWSNMLKKTNLKCCIKIYVKKIVCYLYGTRQFIGRSFASYFGPTISETENQLASWSLCVSVMKEECRGMGG